MAEELDPLDPGAIAPLIARLQALQAQGVTHVCARNQYGELELVTGIAPNDARWKFDDGAAIGVEVTAQVIGPERRQRIRFNEAPPRTRKHC